MVQAATQTPPQNYKKIANHVNLIIDNLLTAYLATGRGYDNSIKTFTKCCESCYN